MHHRPLGLLGTVLALTLAAPGGVATSTAAPSVPVVASAPNAANVLPRGSIRHQAGPHWVWFGPRDWIASYGAYGIAITAPDGTAGIDYGFSSIVCATAPTLQESVATHFAQQRANLRSTSTWRRLTIQASRIRQLPVPAYGPNYFRQVVKVQGRGQGIQSRGEVAFDYSLATGPTYCFSRNQSRYAPARGYGQSIRQLRSMQAALAYSAPSYCTGNTVDAVCRG